MFFCMLLLLCLRVCVASTRTCGTCCCASCLPFHDDLQYLGYTTPELVCRQCHPEGSKAEQFVVGTTVLVLGRYPGTVRYVGYVPTSFLEEVKSKGKNKNPRRYHLKTRYVGVELDAKRASQRTENEFLHLHRDYFSLSPSSYGRFVHPKQVQVYSEWVLAANLIKSRLRSQVTYRVLLWCFLIHCVPPIGFVASPSSLFFWDFIFHFFRLNKVFFLEMNSFSIVVLALMASMVIVLNDTISASTGESHFVFRGSLLASESAAAVTDSTESILSIFSIMKTLHVRLGKKQKFRGIPDVAAQSNMKSFHDRKDAQNRFSRICHDSSTFASKQGTSKNKVRFAC
jgi:hypothetical protein